MGCLMHFEVIIDIVIQANPILEKRDIPAVN
jgi:hypothetical protein